MADNWERIQGLFLEAADLCPEERTRLLETACAGDPALRDQVESLLACDGAGEQRIADALGDTAQSLFESEDVTGTRLGAWRVLREIGRGGMGAVYLATRDDDQFQKGVAIKVVKRGMDTAELLSRFRRERQILANLDHPYIARLIDGGSTPEGRPFLVMEYVEGLAIGVYCERGLDVEQRCRLFLKVCEAVSYAHRNLVIHRDLKPGNILIADDSSHPSSSTVTIGAVPWSYFDTKSATRGLWHENRRSQAMSNRVARGVKADPISAGAAQIRSSPIRPDEKRCPLERHRAARRE